MNLGANLAEEMRREIRRLNVFRIAIVYVTHDASEAMVTSDLIVVMNRRPIEQIDDPVSTCHRPRTRSAGCIGPTNLLDGKRDGNGIVFPGFDMPVRGAPAGAGSGASFLVGPQSSFWRRSRLRMVDCLEIK